MARLVGRRDSKCRKERLLGSKQEKHTAAAAETVRIPSARCESQARKWAYMREFRPGAEETRMQRVSPSGNTKLEPPIVIQWVVIAPFSVLGVAAQKEVTPCHVLGGFKVVRLLMNKVFESRQRAYCLANAIIDIASSVECGLGRPPAPGAMLSLSGTWAAMAAASECVRTRESSLVAGKLRQRGLSNPGATSEQMFSESIWRR